MKRFTIIQLLFTALFCIYTGKTNANVISGYVINSDGNYMTNVSIAVNGNGTAKISTNTKGYYEYEAINGNYTLTASYGEFLTVQKNITVEDKSITCNFVLESLTVLSGNVKLSQKGAYPYAGIYEYKNLIIDPSTQLYSYGISQVIINVEGTLTIGSNAVFMVRNGYSGYSGTPNVSISNLSNSSTKSLNTSSSTEYTVLPFIYGQGGRGGNGGNGANGQTIYQYSYGSTIKIQGNGGDGGGGGAGGFGGGLAGYKGYKGYASAVISPSVSGRNGNDGHDGNTNGGYGGSGYGTTGGSGGRNLGLGGNGATSSSYGSGAGGGGNGGFGGNGASEGAGMGNGGNGGGGGGGGYGGGVLIITANKIVFSGSGQHLYVSGQKGGTKGLKGYAYYINGTDGTDGSNGSGGLIIINSPDFTANSNLWNLNSSTFGYLSSTATPGHGIITGNPQKVLYNVSTPYKLGVTFGTIRNNQGSGIGNVTVKFSTGSSQVYSVQTNSDGNYFISNMYLGSYTMTVVGNGFDIYTTNTDITATSNTIDCQLNKAISTSITNLESKFTVIGGSGYIQINLSYQSIIDIYSISGVLVKKAIINDGENQISIPTGMYLIDRRKVIVK